MEEIMNDEFYLKIIYDYVFTYENMLLYDCYKNICLVNKKWYNLAENNSVYNCHVILYKNIKRHVKSLMSGMGKLEYSS